MVRWEVFHGEEISVNGNWMGYISRSLPKDIAHYMVEVMTLHPLASSRLLISAGLAMMWDGSIARLVVTEKLRIHGETLYWVSGSSVPSPRKVPARWHTWAAVEISKPMVDGHLELKLNKARSLACHVWGWKIQ